MAEDVSPSQTAERIATTRTQASRPKVGRRPSTPAWVSRAVKATKLADVAEQHLRVTGATVYDLARLSESGRELLRVVAGVRRGDNGATAISRATWDTMLTLVADRMAEVVEEFPVCAEARCVSFGRSHHPSRHVSAGLVE